MAKKKTVARRSQPKRTAKATRPKAGPRSQPLPGLEQARDAELDNLCEEIAEDRAIENAARKRSQAHIQAALQRMQQKGKNTHRHGGVELARVPGAEKLRVRLTGEEGDAGDEDLESAERDEARRQLAADDQDEGE